MLQPQYHVGEPDKIDVKVLKKIASLVERGDAVQNEGLIIRLRSCHLVGFAVINGNLVASGAIKNPQTAYVSKVARNSRYDVPDVMRELDYVATDQGYRGNGFAREICGRLVAAYHKSLFATTSDNTMEQILGGLGFIPVGVRWASDRANKEFGLWLRSIG
jgi:hypothetical protein